MIAVTMGDPGGIGPEVIVRALDPATRPAGWSGVRFVIHGSSTALLAAAGATGIEPYWWRATAGTAGLASSSHAVLVIDSDDASRPPRFERGPSALGGGLSYRWVEEAIASTQAGGAEPWRARALVTGPISKAAWDLAGHRRFPGHTELLASRYRAKRVCMMFEGPRLRVALATVHLPLMDVRNVLTVGRVFDAIDLGHEGCRMLGVVRPRIAVAGLNPHAGEGGLLGDEESRLIEPAIRVAREHGMEVSGPFPGDTVFNRAVGGAFDLVVAMYHDQGLIPVKLLARDESVNMTIGLPVVRTSPDHGTAFDIAGTGRANPGSMRAALDIAVRAVKGAIFTADDSGGGGAGGGGG